MTPCSSFPRAWRDLTVSTFRVVVLHDDHLTARRGNLVAREIAEEMGLPGSCETALCNVDLLDTFLGAKRRSMPQRPTSSSSHFALRPSFRRN